MADETGKKAGGRAQNSTYKGKPIKYVVLSADKLNFIQLVAAGHSAYHTAQVLGISKRTAANWKHDLIEHIKEAQQLSIEAAQDAVKCLVPDALASYSRMIRSKRATVSYQPSRDVLVSQRVITDRKTIEQEDANRSTDNLEAELGSIVERAQAIADKRSEEAYPVTPSSEGT